MTSPYELVEDYGPDEDPQVVGRYEDYDKARKDAMKANLSSHPVEPGDEWGPDYYVRVVE